MQPIKLIVEGWRFLPHSYAVVNQFQLLELARRPEVALAVRDRPYYSAAWKPTQGLFSPEDEALLAGLPVAARDDAADVTLRIAAPFDFRPAPGGKTLVFGTAEFKRVPRAAIEGGRDLRTALAGSPVGIVTPSRWSAEGFAVSGAERERIAVVPHGVDPRIHRPASELEKRALREKLGFEGFVFLHVGAMTDNKGVPALLRAFAQVAARRPDARLALKGADALYGSDAMLRQALAQLGADALARVGERIVYLGQALSFAEMAELYRAADAYASPYLGEGFNLPVLEAMACGLPVICTAGGPTDDFVDDTTGWRVNSQAVPVKSGQDEELGTGLLVSEDHLVALMERAMDDADARRTLGAAAAARVADGFTWAKAVDGLLAAARG